MEKELILKNRLKEIRTEQGLSQAKLAEIVEQERFYEASNKYLENAIEKIQ